MQPPLQVTGERVIEEAYLRSRETYLIYLFHISTYRFAIPHVAGRNVLDFGCGTGYGTAMLAEHAAAITGVDLSTEAIAHAEAHYRRHNLTFRPIGRIEHKRLPFPDGFFDAVVSFQVIEHIANTDAYLSEIARVIKSGGVFVVATPDRRTRLLPGQRPWNRFHVREYSQASLRQAIATRFTDIELYRMSGTPSVLAPELRRTRMLKWVTLPFTFPGAPEWWRLWGLNLMARLHKSTAPAGSSAPGDFGIDARDIQIRRDLASGVNLVAIARRP